jgi:hypothetical protein
MADKTKPRKTRMYSKLIDCQPKLANSITAHKLLKGYAYETDAFRELVAEGLRVMRELQADDQGDAPAKTVKKRYANAHNRRLLSLPEPLASELRAYRAERRLSNLSGCVRELVAVGLEAINTRDRTQYP